MDVARRIVFHRLQIRVLQNVERLEQCGSLLPERELIDGDSLVGRADRLLDADLPVGQVLHRNEPAFLLRGPDQLLRDVAFVEAVVRGIDRFLSRLSPGKSLTLRLDQLAQRSGKILLHEDLAGLRCLTLLPGVRQKKLARVLPLLDVILLSLDRASRLCLDRIAIGHLNGWLQDLA